jgi:undecaprenyl-diphosphatase
MSVVDWIASAQIILESMPVSSSGHLVLLCHFFGVTACFDSASFKAFYYILHGPTAFIFLVFFAPYWIHMIRMRPIVFFFIINLVTLIGYFLITPYLKMVPLQWGFVATCCLLFAPAFFSCVYKKNAWSTKDAVVFGLAQIVALVPGVSRMGLLFFVGRSLALSPTEIFVVIGIAEIPLACGGFTLGLYNMYREGGVSSYLDSQILLTILWAGLIAYGALYLVSLLVKKNRLWWFGWYMLIPMTISLFVR